MIDVFVIFIYVGGCVGADACGASTWDTLTWPFSLGRALGAWAISAARPAPEGKA